MEVAIFTGRFEMAHSTPASMKKTLITNTILIFLMTLALPANAQNELDEKGRKTGPWEVTYPDGTLRYSARFVEGKPEGMMKRYAPDGRLVAKLNFREGGDRCYAHLYHENGNLAAEGIYDNQQKDSVWTYYAPGNKTKRLVEEYDNGELHGESRHYYSDGSVSEVIHWKQGVRHGRWTRYFKNGSLMHQVRYRDGVLEGPYVAYHPNGNKEMEGTYVNDLFHGTWRYYDEEEEVILELEYEHGENLTPERLEEDSENFFRKVEENIGNIPDPASPGDQ